MSTSLEDKHLHPSPPLSRLLELSFLTLILSLSSILYADSAKLDNESYNLWQTNAGGNDVHVYNIQDHTLVQRIEVGPQPHGIAYAPGTKQVLITLEKKQQAYGELLWIDPLSFEITHRIKVGRRPQAFAVTPDGNWIYIPCRDGHYWVIDGKQKKLLKKIYTGGLPHNTIISADGHFAYLSPMGTPHKVTIVDIKADHQLLGTLPFSESLRPSALSANGKYFFQHIDKLNGFEVTNIPARTFEQSVAHKNSLGISTTIGPLGWINHKGFQRCHGLAIRPDQQEIWSSCGRNLNIHDLSPPFKQIHTILLSGTGYWLAFTPDSSLAFIALKDKKSVAVINTKSKKVLRHYKAGSKPKRNSVIPAEFHEKQELISNYEHNDAI